MSEEIKVGHNDSEIYSLEITDEAGNGSHMLPFTTKHTALHSNHPGLYLHHSAEEFS